MDDIRCRSWIDRIVVLSRLPRWYFLLPKSFSHGAHWVTDIIAADTLDRFEIPFFGGLASSFVDAE